MVEGLYRVVEITEWVGLPPHPEEDINEAALRELRYRLEGLYDPDVGLIIAVLDAETISDGFIPPLPGDPRVYYQIRYKVLAFVPIMFEVVKGIVRDARQPGLFVSLGITDGFIHKSQIMDEPVEYLPDRRGFRGKETGRIVEVNDIVRARIVQISKPRRAGMLRIGLTMRQPYLGKEEWIAKERAKAR
ncbi:MAG: DNA-directed RNA polymerase [Desulfurococcales archaeon]|nr:DNA-directed RNA polymerase [Desulfurococcales archaeon]